MISTSVVIWIINAGLSVALIILLFRLIVNFISNEFSIDFEIDDTTTWWVFVALIIVALFFVNVGEYMWKVDSAKTVLNEQYGLNESGITEFINVAHTDTVDIANFALIDCNNLPLNEVLSHFRPDLTKEQCKKITDDICSNHNAKE